MHLRVGLLAELVTNKLYGSYGKTGSYLQMFGSSKPTHLPPPGLRTARDIFVSVTHLCYVDRDLYHRSGRQTLHLTTGMLRTCKLKYSVSKTSDWRKSIFESGLSGVS